MQYALRIDDEFAAVVSYLERLGYGGFAVEEMGGDHNNLHWHFLIECPADVKIQKIRTSLNRAVPALKGNGKYSLTVVKDVDKYVRYLCKGEAEGAGIEAVWRQSILYDDAKLEELHMEYWAANKKMKKKVKGSMIDTVIGIAKDKKIDWHKREELAKLYIREVGAQGKPINLFSIRANLNAVQLALCPDDECLNVLADLVLQH